MDVLTTVAEARAWHVGGSVGLVPTMGFLHAGHMALVARAVAENERAVATIFVNPTQFGPGEDLATYPRDLEGDLAQLSSAGCHAVWVPAPETVYPPGFDTAVEPGSVARPLEGAHRPGHFRGVATVVLKLLNVWQPARAYFGRKDAQQLAVIRAVVRDLDLAVRVVACDTVREPDGLALSSRNVYLAPDERRAAGVLYRALEALRSAWAAGEQDAARLRAVAGAVLAAEPLAQPDYVSIADPDTLAELDVITGPALALLAVRIGRTRLIDNLLLDDHLGEG